MAKRILAITYSGNDWHRKQPFPDALQRASYEAFSRLASEYGFRVIRTSVSWFSRGAFSRYWEYEEKSSSWKKVRATVKPALIFDKATLDYAELHTKQHIAASFFTVNDWELDLLASDKLLTNTLFSEFVPPTVLVRTTADLKRAVADMQGKELVLKPRLGHGGKGIRMLSRSRMAKERVKELSILQPVIDTSAGIPGLYKGIHDVRVIFTGETPATAYIRTPAPGTKLCNISQGGGVRFISVNALPKQLRPVLQAVLKRLAIFSYKIFSADFFFDPEGTPQLIELNTKPIMYFPEGFEAERERMHRAYLDYFQSIPF